MTQPHKEIYNSDSIEILYNSDFDEHLITYDDEMTVQAKLYVNAGDNIGRSGEYVDILNQLRNYIKGESISEDYTETVRVNEDDSETLFDEVVTNTKSVTKNREIIDIIENIEDLGDELEVTVSMTDGGSVTLTIRRHIINNETPYKTGIDITQCNHCGAELESQCMSSGFGEYTYCEACDIKYTRDRNVFDDEVYMMYYCAECDEHHQQTEPDGEWEEREYALTGLEEFGFRCKCGNYIDGRDINPNETISCRCGREITLTVTD